MGETAGNLHPTNPMTSGRRSAHPIAKSILTQRGQIGPCAAQKGARDSKLPLAVDAQGMPLGAIITAGTVADCTQAGDLIGGVFAEAPRLQYRFHCRESAIAKHITGNAAKEKPYSAARIRQGRFISCDTSPRTLSCTSNPGAASPPDTQNTPLPSSLPSKSDVSTCRAE